MRSEDKGLSGQGPRGMGREPGCAARQPAGARPEKGAGRGARSLATGAQLSSDLDGVVVHAALVEHADGLRRSRTLWTLKRRDAPVALPALLVDVHIDVLHPRERSHLDASAPRAAGHALCVRCDGVVGVILDPVLDRGVRNLHVWVLGHVAADLAPQRACGRPVVQAVAEGVEEAGAVPRLGDDPRGVTPDHRGVRALVGDDLGLAFVRPRVLVRFPRLLEVRALVRLMRTVALVAGEGLARGPIVRCFSLDSATSPASGRRRRPGRGGSVRAGSTQGEEARGGRRIALGPPGCGPRAGSLVGGLPPRRVFAQGQPRGRGRRPSGAVAPGLLPLAPRLLLRPSLGSPRVSAAGSQLRSRVVRVGVRGWVGTWQPWPPDSVFRLLRRRRVQVQLLSADDGAPTIPRVPEVPDGLVDAAIVANCPKTRPTEARLKIYEPPVVYRARQHAATRDELLPGLEPPHVHEVPDVGLGPVVAPDELLLLRLPSLDLARVHRGQIGGRSGGDRSRDTTHLSERLAIGLGAHATAAVIVHGRGRNCLTCAFEATLSPSVWTGSGAALLHRGAFLPSGVVGLGTLPLRVRAAVLACA
mmetsp:Transcript_52513/g.114916  ORF Transcript_52513/g.114916 Transcript_52513/m.114916 type:complete len:588 (+) Transcript_52513:288-2051(+)